MVKWGTLKTDKSPKTSETKLKHRNFKINKAKEWTCSKCLTRNVSPFCKKCLPEEYEKWSEINE